MTYDQLNFIDVEYNGQTVHSFDINTRYHGYTWDYTLFHVLDENSNAYTSYSLSDFQDALQSGAFDNGEIIQVNQNNSVSYFQPSNLLKYGFIIAVVIMLISIAKR